MIGTTIGHFEIVAKLGEGGMGVVYKAEDTRLRRTVALKFLPVELTQDRDARERLRLEAQTASALDHPNICTIHEIDETPDGRVFIAMSYYDGQSLKQRIAEGPLPIADAIRLATETARALTAAHEAGVIHRDIKPANVMLTKRGDVKLVDFGVAKLSDRTELTRTGVTFGTIAYMAPEYVLGQAADPQTDVWALGVVLYEMLAGKRPFDGEHAHRHDERDREHRTACHPPCPSGSAGRPSNASSRRRCRRRARIGTRRRARCCRISRR